MQHDGCTTWIKLWQRKREEDTKRENATLSQITQNSKRICDCRPFLQLPLRERETFRQREEIHSISVTSRAASYLALEIEGRADRFLTGFNANRDAQRTSHNSNAFSSFDEFCDNARARAGIQRRNSLDSRAFKTTILLQKCARLCLQIDIVALVLLISIFHSSRLFRKFAFYSK